MFTVEQIKAAHAKVKSGADFPAYIQEIKSLGVTHYEAFVTDGHTDYHGINNHMATMPPKYEPMSIADVPALEKFKSELLAHQEGKTNYLTFIQMCAETGIEKWEVSIDKMTCTYYDKAGKIVLLEVIPQA